MRRSHEQLRALWCPPALRRPVPYAPAHRNAVRSRVGAASLQQASPVPVVTAPRNLPLGAPALAPVPGAAPTEAYGVPLSGSPEPLGCTYNRELVSPPPDPVWGGAGPGNERNMSAATAAPRRRTDAVGWAREPAALAAGAPAPRVPRPVAICEA